MLTSYWGAWRSECTFSLEQYKITTKLAIDFQIVEILSIGGENLWIDNREELFLVIKKWRIVETNGITERLSGRKKTQTKIDWQDFKLCACNEE